MQNPVVVAPNGAICCKLWPQTILGWGAKILGSTPCPGATPSLQGQPLCLWGNPFAPGATPLTQGQLLCLWGNPFASGTTPLPQGQPLCPRGYEGSKAALGWHVAPFGCGLGSGPHFPGKCCKTIVFYIFWEPARYTVPDEADEADLSKMRHSRQLWPRVLHA